MTARRTLISSYDWGQDPAVTITVGAGSFITGLPATNMLRIQPQVVAQAGDTSITFTLHLGATRTIGLIHFQNLVTASSGTIRVQAGSYDSGTLNSWATGASGVYSPLLYAALGRPRVFIPPAPVSADTIDVTIDAVSGSLQIGFMGACEVFEPPQDMLIGPVTTILDESELQTVPFGSTYVTLRGKRRRIDFALPPLEDANATLDDYTDYYIDVFDLVLINGKSSPLIVAKFPDDTDNLERNQVWGFSSTDQQFTNRFYGYHDTTFQITQLI